MITPEALEPIFHALQSRVAELPESIARERALQMIANAKVWAFEALVFDEPEGGMRQYSPAAAAALILAKLDRIERKTTVVVDQVSQLKTQLDNIGTGITGVSSRLQDLLTQIANQSVQPDLKPLIDEATQEAQNLATLVAPPAPAPSDPVPTADPTATGGGVDWVKGADKKPDKGK